MILTIFLSKNLKSHPMRKKSSSSPVVRRFLAIAREELRGVEEVGAQ